MLRPPRAVARLPIEGCGLQSHFKRRNLGYICHGRHDDEPYACHRLRHHVATTRTELAEKSVAPDVSTDGETYD
jgi:hypothetical protein